MDTTLALFPQTTQVAPNGHICVGGVDLVDLAHALGTPLYVYDEATIRARCRAYHDALAAHYPASGQVAYASKAFLCLAIAQLIAKENMGLDVVSGGELYVAQRAGFPAERVHLHGNNKSPSEIAQALEAGVGRIVVNSLGELEMVKELAAQRAVVAQIWLRLSPGIDVHTHVYRKTGLIDSKFGFSTPSDDLEVAIERARDSPYLRLVGLHAHIGSQVFELEPFAQAVEATLDVAAQMRDRGLALLELSPGGGLGVRYVESDPAVSIASYVRHVCEAVVTGCQRQHLSLPRLVLEPGRSIVGPAGVALYTIGARKVIPGVRTYVGVDGGLADNPRPALYSARYAALLANRANRMLTETVTIAGKFCESGDVLIRDVSLPSTRPGDVLAIPCSGAYQLSMSSNYNQALRPAVALVGHGQAHLLVRRETYDNLVERDHPLGSAQVDMAPS